MPELSLYDAAAARRRIQKPKPVTIDTQEDKSLDMPSPIPLRRPAPAEAPPARSGSSFGEKLGGFLESAAYGIQANVGRAKPGAEFAQGLSKGVVGAGVAAAARAKNEALRASSAQDMAGRLALIKARQEGNSPEAAAARAAAVAEAELPSKLKLLEAGAEASEAKLKRLKDQDISRATNKDEREGWEWAWAQTMKQLGWKANRDPELASQIAQAHFAGWKKPGQKFDYLKPPVQK